MTVYEIRIVTRACEIRPALVPKKSNRVDCRVQAVSLIREINKKTNARCIIDRRQF